MSTPESITVSLEWAKKLKEAGWPQDSYWTWVEDCKKNQLRDKTDWNAYKLITFRGEEHKVFTDYWAMGADAPFHPMFAAPTAEEILRQLPEEYDIANGRRLVLSCGKRIRHHGFGYWVMYETPIPPHDSGEAFCTNNIASLANAAAAMYCSLAEQKLLPEA